MAITVAGSAVVAKTPLDGLYLNAGWCYGGFKATPGSGWVFAHTIAHARPHPLNEGLGLARLPHAPPADPPWPRAAASIGSRPAAPSTSAAPARRRDITDAMKGMLVSGAPVPPS